jgi:CO/xanthine dehydrogenase FAD-binding subunit
VIASAGPSPNFAAPISVPELCDLLANRNAHGLPTQFLAGGTDWYVERHAGLALPQGLLVVDLSRVPSLQAIDLDGDRLRLGACVTFRDLRQSPLVSSRVPLLAQMAADVGARQIQARGTIGGNLGAGSPAADGVAALAALDADVLLTSCRGERSVPLRAFYTGYRASVRRFDEVISAVEMQIPSADSLPSWRKVGARRAQAISKVALAAVAVRDGDRVVRIGLGMASVAPTVAFLDEVRGLVTSTPLHAISEAALDAATSSGIRPIDDLRSTAAYRLHVARALVRNVVRGLGAPLR